MQITLTTGTSYTEAIVKFDEDAFKIVCQLVTKQIMGNPINVRVEERRFIPIFVDVTTIIKGRIRLTCNYIDLANDLNLAEKYYKEAIDTIHHERAQYLKFEKYFKIYMLLNPTTVGQVQI